MSLKTAKISPAKLEEQLREIPMVREVMVYGAANGFSADTVVVATSVHPDPELSKGMSSYGILEHLQAKIDQLNTTLPLFQQIQMIHIRDQEFAKTVFEKNQTPHGMSLSAGRIKTGCGME